jgi:hypothetical protein
LDQGNGYYGCAGFHSPTMLQKIKNYRFSIFQNIQIRRTMSACFTIISSLCGKPVTIKRGFNKRLPYSTIVLQYCGYRSVKCSKYCTTVLQYKHLVQVFSLFANFSRPSKKIVDPLDPQPILERVDGTVRQLDRHLLSIYNPIARVN